VIESQSKGVSNTWCGVAGCFWNIGITPWWKWWSCRGGLFWL